MARLVQGRYGEAVASANEYARHGDSPISFAILAASHAHLGERREAREALARYRGLTPVPPEDAAPPFLRNPAQLKRYVDGIAVAEGES